MTQKQKVSNNKYNAGKGGETTQKEKASIITTERKLEIAGVIVMAIALLLGISILTYHPSDYGILRALEPGDIFNVNEGPALRIQNGLGVVGAYLAQWFVQYLFGYISFVIPLLTFAAGWITFRHRSVVEIGWPIIYGLWTMILIATIIGWFGYEQSWNTLAWNGTSGLIFARTLRFITGYYGSVIILTALTLVTLLLLVDRDLQKTIDNLKMAFTNYRSKKAAESEQRKQKRADEKARQSDQRVDDSEEKSIDTTLENESDTESESESYPIETKADKGEEEESPHKESSATTEEAKNGSPEEIEDKGITFGKEDPEVSKERDEPETEMSSKSEQGLDGNQKDSSEDSTGEEGEQEDDDVNMEVYIGKGEAEAGNRELDKRNKKQAKEIKSAQYKFPQLKLLDTPPDKGNDVDMEEIRTNKKIILDKLKRHKIDIQSIHAIVGPTVTLYELDPSPDVKISKIESYANDLKMATAAHGLRIIAPIPGRAAVGIEVPNQNREIVYIKDVINTKKFVDTDMQLPVAFGKTIENEVFMLDLTQMPHLLMAGATGSGKSVGINTIITCLLYKKHPDNLKFVMVDPKKIELSLYRNIDKQYMAVLPDVEEPIITDTAKVLETLNSLCEEMDQRYELLKKAMVRDVKDYNRKFKEGELDTSKGHRHLPYIVVVIDELADLMMTAGKQIEEPVARLAQLARAIGIHLVVATQRPSVNVITGTIKANFPARIAYQVASKVDSRTILDTKGADQLVGRGDMLFSNGGKMIRIQNAFVSAEEVERITEFIGEQDDLSEPYYLPKVEEEEGDAPDTLEEKDELFEDAAKVVVRHQQGSVSLIQRKLKLGYNRAGRIIDQLFAAGIVGPYQGSTAREVLLEDEEELDEMIRTLDD